MGDQEFFTDLNEFKNSILKFVRKYLNDKPTTFHIHVNPNYSAVNIEMLVKECLENIKFT